MGTSQRALSLRRLHHLSRSACSTDATRRESVRVMFMAGTIEWAPANAGRTYERASQPYPVLPILPPGLSLVRSRALPSDRSPQPAARSLLRIATFALRRPCSYCAV